MRPEHPRERGFALLIVLWTVVLLTLIATRMVASGRGEAQLASNLRRAAVLEAAADGGFAEGVFHALDGSPRHWAADGALHALRVGEAEVEVRIDNEAGKIDLNTAPPELLGALFHVLGTASQQAAALASGIAEWRFAGGRQTDAAGGSAVAVTYRAAGRAYAPPGAPFQSLEELGLVLGMTPELLRLARPHLTIYHDGEPDLALADASVRAAWRESTGGEPPSAPARGDERAIGITARARDGTGGGFARHGVVKLGARTAGGDLFQVLTWETPGP